MPVNARVSFALNLPGRADSSSCNSTLAVWAAAQRLAWVSLAHCDDNCVTLLARVVLTLSNLAVWAAVPLPLGRGCSSLQSKFNLNLLRKFKFKFTGKLITFILSFNVLSQILKLKFKKCRSYKYATLPLLVHWQPGALPLHVQVIWSWTGCR